MSTLSFTKLEAIGNNFVLVDAHDLPQQDWPVLARHMCAHHFGVGADGLLALLPSDAGDFAIRMFNPDGSEDACGNGLRCAAAYVRSAGLSSADELVFEAIDGLRHAEVAGDGAVRINMGRPSLRAADIPANLPVGEVLDYPLDIGGQVRKVTCVSVGTPHAVIYAPLESFWDRIPDVSVGIEIHPAFPKRISVTWCAQEPPDVLRIRTWERSVGPTLGCGTGACAALVSANLHGLVGRSARVISPGGTLEIEWPDRGDIFMTGPARIVFEGSWPIEMVSDT